MLKPLSWIALFVLLATVLGAPQENKTWKNEVMTPNATHEVAFGSAVNQARCYDSRLAQFINTGLQYYSHNMGQLSQYILDQIKRAGYGQYWLVEAVMINGRRQGLDWQLLTNGDIFATSSRYGCYYHDTSTFILVLRY